MLDNEPHVHNEEGGGARDGVTTTPSGDATESTTPVRRTRAPRRKATPAAETAVASSGAEPGAAVEAASAVDAAADAPVAPARRRRKAAAPAAQPALIPEPALLPEPALAEPALAEPAQPSDVVASSDVPEAPVKATRSRSRKKAAAPAAAEEPMPAVTQPAVTQPAVTQPAVTQPAVTEPAVVSEEPAPVAARAATPVVGVLPLDDELVEEEPAPARRSRRVPALPPAVLFMPPEPDAELAPAPRRTRRATAAPVAAEPVRAEPARPEPVRADPVRADPVRAESGAEGAAAADLEEPTEVARRSRRRRRGAAEEPAEGVADTVAPALDEPVDEPDESADDIEDGTDDDDDDSAAGRRRRRRGRRGRGRGKGPADEGDEAEFDATAEPAAEAEDDEESEEGDGVTRRRRRRRRKGAGDTDSGGIEDGVHTVVRVREPRRTPDEVQGVSGSTRLEAKRQRRRDGREQRRTRPPILSESEFLARREAVDRIMVVRQKPDRTQIAVIEDGILVEHYVSRTTSGTMVGNVYLGKVQNVLPSMEAAFVDVGRGRNAVLYAGEVNWDATGLEGRARSIEQALRSGDSVLVQVTKDPIGHKGARLSSHIALSGRHLVYVPNGNASGISRKLPDNERKRLRDVLKKMVPDGAGVIVRTAAEGASEDELARDVKRLQAQWEDIQARAAEGHAPAALSEEPDLVIRVVRDLFNEDFREVVIQGEQAYGEVESYLNSVSPDLVERLHRYTGTTDIFAEKRIDEQILKGLDRKVFLPSGGHLVIDRTEAMTVVDVNTGKYTGAGGNLEETVTRNNLEAAEEIVRQLRLRDLGGIVVIDFIDMVLESNRELVLRRLTECLGRDRTKHQVTEITSLGLVQMTRKRIGAGLLEAFSETCDHCKGRGVLIHTEPVPEKRSSGVVNQVKAVAAAARTEAPQPVAQQSAPVQSAPAQSASAQSASAQSASAQSASAQSAPAQSAPAQSAPAQSGRSRRRRGGADNLPPAEPVEAETAAETAVPELNGPAAATAEVPPAAGSGIVARTAPNLPAAETDDEYDISGYDLSRYDNGNGKQAADVEPLQLTGADDPDAAEDDEEDDVVGAGTGRRRSRRGGARRRTRP